MLWFLCGAVRCGWGRTWGGRAGKIRGSAKAQVWRILSMCSWSTVVRAGWPHAPQDPRGNKDQLTWKYFSTLPLLTFNYWMKALYPLKGPEASARDLCKFSRSHTSICPHCDHFWNHPFIGKPSTESNTLGSQGVPPAQALLHSPVPSLRSASSKKLDLFCPGSKSRVQVQRWLTL